MIKLLIRNFLFIFLATALTLFSNTFTTPSEIHLELNLAFDSGPLNDFYDVKIEVGSKFQNGSFFKHAEYIRNNFQFQNGLGFFNLDFVKDFNLDADRLRTIDNPFFKIFIVKPGLSFQDDQFVMLPFPSTPFALQARYAERVFKVDADNIIGPFNNPFVVNDYFVVSQNGQQMMIVSDNYVGILSDRVNSNYAFEVNGTLNATQVLMNGVPIDRVISPWTLFGNQIYIHSDQSVGIGKRPLSDFKLDVSGNINATAFFIDNIPLYDWFESQETFFFRSIENGQPGLFLPPSGSNPRFVGINISSENVSAITEVLTVSGGIRLSNSSQIQPLPGTIEYDENDDTFYGYLDQGVRVDLVGPQLIENTIVSPNHLIFWKSRNEIAALPNVFVDPLKGYLGLGRITFVPSSPIHIKAAFGDDIFKVQNDNQVLIEVDNAARMALGKAVDPHQNYGLDVAGSVNADALFLAGQDILQSLASNSVFTNANHNWIPSPYYQTPDSTANSFELAHLFYNDGFVGLGTDQPEALLHLKSNVNASAALIFQQANGGSFIMGVSDNSFVIGSGRDFSSPIMRFSELDSSWSLGNIVDTFNFNPGFYVGASTGFLVEGRNAQSSIDLNSFSQGQSAAAMFFDAKKAAFAAVQSKSWSETMISTGSVLIGVNNETPGEYAAVLGGQNNVASGKYSVVAGGQDNITLGDYSFAGGYRAKANHFSSFVWSSFSDLVGVDQYRESTSPRQFLIYANGGVGINTNDTADAAFKIKRSNVDEDYFVVLDNQGNTKFLLDRQGRMAVGHGAPIAALDVSGSMMVGSANFTQMAPSSLFTLRNTGTYDDVFRIEDQQGKPIFVVDKQGNVGINREPTTSVVLSVSGNVLADKIGIFTGSDILSLDDLIVWRHVEADLKSIFYNQGNVIIGSDSTPSASLHLVATSNLNPILAFSQDNQSYSMGLVSANANHDSVFALLSSANINFSLDQSNLASLSPFIVSNNSIGIGTLTPTGALTVSGASYFTGPVIVGSQSFLHNLDSHGSVGELLVEKLLVEEFTLNGQSFQFDSSQPWQSLQEERGIFTTASVVLIGASELPTGMTTEPQLFVSGDVHATVVSASSLEGSMDQIDVQEIKFQSDGSVHTLKVENSNLTFDGANISSQVDFSLNTDSVQDAALSVFKTNTSFVPAPIIYNFPNDEFSSAANFNFFRSLEIENNLRVTQNLNLGYSPNNRHVLSAQSFLDAKLDTALVSPFDHTLIDFDIHLNKAWTDKKRLTVFDLSVDSDPGINWTNASLVGLQVSINHLYSQNHNVYSALFNGGPVLIGYDVDDLTPQDLRSYSLLVNGSISANHLFVNESLLNLDSLKSPGLIFTQNKLGIGFSDISDFYANSSPYALSVSGNMGLFGTLDTQSLFVSNSFVVDNFLRIDVEDSVFVIGESDISNFEFSVQNPTPEILYVSTIKNNQQNFVGNEIQLTLQDEASVFNQPLNDFPDFLPTGIPLSASSTAFELNFGNSAPFSLSGNITGLVVSMNNISVVEDSDSQIYGLHVDVSAPSSFSGGQRIAALINGGGVGIGTLPASDVALAVSGSVVFDSLQLNELQVGNITVNNFLEVERLSANHLAITTFNVENLFVSSNFGIGTHVPSTSLHVVGDVSVNGLFEFNSGFVIADEVTINRVLSANNFRLYNALNADFFVNRLRVIDVTANRISVNALSVFNTLNASIISANLVNVDNTLFVGEFLPQDRVSYANNALAVSGNVSVNGTIFANRFEIGESNTEFTLPDFRDLASNLITMNQLVVNQLSVETIISMNYFVFDESSLLQDLTLFNELLAINSPFISRFGDELRFYSSSATQIEEGRDLLSLYFNDRGAADNGALITFDAPGNRFRASEYLRFDPVNLSLIASNSEGVSLSSIQMTPEISNSQAAFSLNFVVSRNLAVDSISNYKGLNIVFDVDRDNNQNFLGVNETAVGLHVDMTSVSNGVGSVPVNRYAAVFEGGNVGVGVLNPSALLHISGSPADNLFQLDSNNQAFLTVVSESMFLNMDPFFDEAALLNIQLDDDIQRISFFDGSNSLLTINRNEIISALQVSVNAQVFVQNLEISEKLTVNRVLAQSLFISRNMSGSSPVSLNFTVADAANNFAGIDISMVSKELAPSLTDFSQQTDVPDLAEGTFYGLKVNVSNSAANPVPNNHFSAGFFGAPVIISALANGDDVISAISSNDSVAPLNIYSPIFVDRVNKTARLLSLVSNVNQQTQGQSHSFSINGQIKTPSGSPTPFRFFDFSILEQDGENSLMSFFRSSSSLVAVGVGKNVYDFVGNNFNAGSDYANTVMFIEGDIAFVSENPKIKFNDYVELSLDDSNLLKIKGDGIEFKSDNASFFKISNQNDVVVGTIKLGNVSNANFQLGDGQGLLNIIGNTAGENTQFVENSRYVSVLHNLSSTPGARIMSLILDQPRSDASFIDFNGLTGGSSQTFGAVKVNIDDSGQSQGVVFETKGADYAEYLKKMQLDDDIQPGDLVGVFNGVISKETVNADLVLPISSSPAVAGNLPPLKDKDHYALVSFLGQVLVKVRGPVEKGDYIIPSGFADGYGVAVAPVDLKSDQFSSIVGRAWSDKSSESDEMVNVAVGFQFRGLSVQAHAHILEKQQNDIDQMKADILELKEKIQGIIDNKNSAKVQ